MRSQTKKPLRVLVMASLEAVLFGGVAMGLASALHCGAMCSGICGSALLFLRPDSNRQRLAYLLTLQAGRITTYAIFGAVGALFGSALITPDAAVKFRTLQWAAAVAMMAMGLAMAGMLPRFAILDRGAVLVSSSIERLTAPLRHWPRVAPFALGMLWGGNACPMVYGAVFTATLTGSVAQGVTFMSGFGLGTLPAVLAAGYGVSKLKAISGRISMQTAAGIAMAGIGFASLYTPWQSALAICFSR